MSASKVVRPVCRHAAAVAACVPLLACEAGPVSAPADAPDVATSPPPPACLAPDFPRLTSYPPSLELSFESAGALEVGLSHEVTAASPPTWQTGSTLTLPDSTGEVVVFAREAAQPADSACAPVTSARLRIEAAFSGAAGSPDSEAVAYDDPRIRGWAAEVVDVTFGAGVDDRWKDLRQAEGPAGTDPLASLVLGNGGSVTLRFDPPIRDGDGDDFAIFENSITDTFLELAFVEVSTDGEQWTRFATATLRREPVSGYGALEPSDLQGFAGKHRVGFGTPFDLALLETAPAVQRGHVDLEAIQFVRIVDIIGDGSVLDSFGNPVYDPTPTFGSGGFDLDGVGVLSPADP